MYIGLIPARGGSKGIPRKNLRLLMGKSLLQWSKEAADGSESLKRVFLSTDDQEMALHGKELDLEVPFLRPTDISQDSSPMIDVLFHFTEWWNQNEAPFKGLVLLQPSSPLRNSHHIDEAIELFDKNKPEALVSVTRVPHQHSPQSQMCLKGDYLTGFQGQMEQKATRQEKPLSWARNGPAILILSPEAIKNKTVYPKKMIPYVMSPYESLDIDHPEDFDFIEAYLKGKKL